VSSLAALAQRAVEDRDAEAVVAVLDARMNEIYAGAYRLAANGLVQPAGEERLLPPDALQIPAGDWTGAGPGFAAYPGIGASLPATHPDILPDAAAVARLAAVAFAAGDAIDPADAMPVYLRDTVAWQRRT